MCQQMQTKGCGLAVVGLGNPGRNYEHTRHNVGFQVVDELARRLRIALKERNYQASCGLGCVEGRQILLCQPLTWMNLSGPVVKRILNDFNISADQMVVVHDDLDLPCGRIRLLQRGGAGGHRGVLSIIEHLGHQEFLRLKLGIGRPQEGELVEQFVLQPPYPDETVAFAEMIVRGADAVQVVLTEGMASAMNRCNRPASSKANADSSRLD
jgi:peptidyl-tRNA hydrolase, PTH1 family